MGQLDTELEPLDVQVMGNDVVLLGPRVAIALSATAAAETARRLGDAAAIAARGERPAPQPPQTLSRDE